MEMPEIAAPRARPDISRRLRSADGSIPLPRSMAIRRIAVAPR
jgi:hypothetical protein